MDEIEKLSNHLIENLKTKKKYLFNILSLTKFQTKAIESQEDEKLSQYINEKQIAIDNINILDKDFIDKFNLVKASLGVTSLDEVKNNSNSPLKNVKTELDDIYKLIEQISVIEKENSTKLNKEFDDIKSKIKEVHAGKKIINAYNSEIIQNDGVFLDTKK